MLRTIGELELRRGGGSLDRLEVESRRDHVAVRLGDNGQVQRSRLGHEEALYENIENKKRLIFYALFGEQRFRVASGSPPLNIDLPPLLS